MSRQQLGTTLIELMISMTLGMVIIAGISEIFLQFRKSAKLQSSISHMMEDGGYLTEMLSKEFRRVGFLRSPKAFNGGAMNIFGLDNNVLVGATSPLTKVNLAQGEAIHGGVSDTVAIRYQLNDWKDNPADWGTSPCTMGLGLGSDATENPETNVQVVTVYFYVDQGELYCNAKRELITPGYTGVKMDVLPLTDCTLSSGLPVNPQAYCTTNPAKTCVAPAAAGSYTCEFPQGVIPIISNVDRLIVKYGVDSDCDGTANYYTDAAGVNALNILDPTTLKSVFLENTTMIANCSPKTIVSAWQLIVAIKLFVVIESEEDYVALNAGTFSIEGVLCNGNGVMACPDSNNRRIYKVFSTTVAIRS